MDKNPLKYSIIDFNINRLILISVDIEIKE